MCIRDRLKAMIEEGGYSSQTIFNVDETGLFWKKMPKRTFTAREEKKDVYKRQDLDVCKCKISCIKTKMSKNCVEGSRYARE